MICGLEDRLFCSSGFSTCLAWPSNTQRLKYHSRHTERPLHLSKLARAPLIGMTELYDDSLSADPASDFEDSSRESDGSTEAGNLHAFEEKRKLYRLGISKEYVRGWTRQAAFREFYQNWYVFLMA